MKIELTEFWSPIEGGNFINESHIDGIRKRAIDAPETTIKDVEDRIEKRNTSEWR